MKIEFLKNTDLTEIEKACNLPSWGERQLTFGALENDKIVGFVSADFVLDECTIFNIGVLPDYRKQGIALMLINKLIDEAKERDFAFISLEVRSENAPACKLYEKAGFILRGKRKGYYKNPDDDALIYTLKLR